MEKFKIMSGDATSLVLKSDRTSVVVTSTDHDRLIETAYFIQNGHDMIETLRCFLFPMDGVNKKILLDDLMTAYLLATNKKAP